MERQEIDQTIITDMRQELHLLINQRKSEIIQKSREELERHIQNRLLKERSSHYEL